MFKEHTHDHHFHDHEHDGCCEHGHYHEQNCCCKHDHKQEHTHKQEHIHEQKHVHNHHEHSHTNPVPHVHSRNPVKVYLLENLGCAHCAAKMEEQINRLEGVDYATITFATKQLRIAANHPELLLPQIDNICNSIESGIRITERDAAPVVRKTADASENRRKKTAQASPVKSIQDFLSNEKTVLAQIIIGAVLFVIGKILEQTETPFAPLLTVHVIAYIILGGQIVCAAVRNLFKGQVFDENFLMSIATLGAFAIREFPEAVGVMLFYRIGEFFEHKAVEKSRSQIMDAVDLRPEVIHRINNDGISVIPAQEARIGDILLVRAGDRIPLDGTVTEGESRIDTSAITGEPVPVKVFPGSSLLSGCLNTSGQLKIRVEKTLQESMVSRILDSVENAAASKPKIDHFITRFARVYTPIVVLLALAVAVLPPLITGAGWQHWIYTALTFLVMSCPCAIVLSVPLAFFSGIGAASKLGILFKGGLSIEALKQVKAVVMDKTGTITKGNFAVQKVISFHPELTEDALLAKAAACESTSTHPIANSIVKAAEDKGLVISSPESVKEISGKGLHAVLAHNDYFCGNRRYMEEQKRIFPKQEENGFGTEVYFADTSSVLGKIVIADTMKEDACSAVAKMKKQGLHTVILTGDTEETAQTVADKAGIDKAYGKLLPQDKFKKLEEIRQEYGSVMFVGDGINDAPVLAGADVGAAMGSGSDAAIEAADVVFMNSNMESVPHAMDIARLTSRIAWQNVIFAIVIKALVMVLGFFGFASMWAAVFADTGVAVICIVNSIRILYYRTHSL
ncbi:MAG: heavy metal translocating P-type ATPase [Eubacterium sp.]|nr:heavy metal translocating P-type ATPase [Eubacterium sp.]